MHRFNCVYLKSQGHVNCISIKEKKKPGETINHKPERMKSQWELEDKQKGRIICEKSADMKTLIIEIKEVTML